jgi:predicted RND superfamily exporter protein
LGPWERIGDLAARRSRPLLALIAALTLFFAFGLARLDVDTTFLSFVGRDTRELVETIENDFAEGSYLTLVFESRSERSLLEPELLHQQLRIIQQIRAEFPVTTFSLVEGIDRGLLRVKRTSLLDHHDYSTIAEAILGIAGGRTVRDLEKVTAHFLSHPDAIAFYARLRIAQGVAALPAPGAPDSRYEIPYVKAIKALVRTSAADSRPARRLLQAEIRARADALATPELAVHALSDDLVSWDIDSDTQRNVALLAAMVLVVDALCVLALFRSVRELGVVLAILACACVWTFGLAGLLGVKISFLHLLGVPILLGTGIDDTLVFGRRLAEEARRTSAFPDALRATYRGVGNAIFLTTFTTFVAFLIAAATSTAGVVASFFLLFSVSMAVVFALTVLLEGALRTELARRGARWGAPEGPRPSLLDAATAALTRPARRLIGARAGPVIAAGAALFALAVASATRVESDLRRQDLLQPGMPTHRANEAMQRWFGDFRVGFVVLEGEVENPVLLERMQRLEERMSSIPEIEQVLGTANVESVIGLLDKQGVRIRPDLDVRAALDGIAASDRTADYVLDMSFREAADYVMRRTGDRWDGLLVRFFVPGEAGSNALAACDAIRREIAATGLDRVPGVAIAIGGGDIIYPLESLVYVDALSRSFLLSLAGSLLVLLAIWRRAGPSLVAMAPVVLAAALVIGAMPVFGVDLNPLNLGIGAIVVGLGIDYPIHIFERYEEERRVRGLSPREAAAAALDTLGPHLLAATLTTVVGFAAACVLLLPMSTSFGLLTGAAILLVYLASLFLLPALLVWLHETGAGGATPHSGGSVDSTRADSPFIQSQNRRSLAVVHGSATTRSKWRRALASSPRRAKYTASPYWLRTDAGAIDSARR